MTKTIEVTGKTIEEALASALARLERRLLSSALPMRWRTSRRLPQPLRRQSLQLLPLQRLQTNRQSAGTSVQRAWKRSCAAFWSIWASRRRSP